MGKIYSRSHCNHCKMRAFGSGKRAPCPSAAGAGAPRVLCGSPKSHCCDWGVIAVPAGLHCQQCPLPTQWSHVELSSSCHSHVHKGVNWTKEALKHIFVAWISHYVLSANIATHAFVNSVALTSSPCTACASPSVQLCQEICWGRHQTWQRVMGTPANSILD